jgi:hypothetical protein
MYISESVSLGYFLVTHQQVAYGQKERKKVRNDLLVNFMQLKKLNCLVYCCMTVEFLIELHRLESPNVL